MSHGRVFTRPWVVGSLAIERARVIYHATHFWSSLVIATVRRPHVLLLDMRHPIGVASRRSSLFHSQSVPSSTVRYATFRVAQTCVALITDFSLPPKSQVTLIDQSGPVILTLILIIYIFYTQTPHQTLIRPERGRLLARSTHAPY